MGQNASSKQSNIVTENTVYDGKKLVKNPTLKRIDSQKRVDQMLFEEDIRSKILKCIFIKDGGNMVAEVKQI